MSSGAQNLLEIRNDPEYRNWYAIGNAFLLLAGGLRKYAEIKMKEFHALITTNTGGGKCNCMCSLGMKSNPHARATTCVWAQELKKFHVFKNKADIPWHQSDSNKWHDPVAGYWEIAKLFMSDLGSNPAKVTDPNTTDVGPLLNLFKFCKHLKVQKPLLKAVTERRNQWAHAPNHKLSDGDKNAAFQDIKLLMNDPELQVSKEVQDCGPTINKVEVVEVLIVEENELHLIEELRRIREYENLEMNKKLEDANKKIENLMKLVNSLCSKITVLLLRSEITVLILTLLLFVLSRAWRLIPSLWQWCFAVFFIFSQVGDKSGIVSDEGKMNSDVNIIIDNPIFWIVCGINHRHVSRVLARF